MSVWHCLIACVVCLAAGFGLGAAVWRNNAKKAGADLSALKQRIVAAGVRL